MPELKSALTAQTRDAEDEQVLDLDSVLEEHDLPAAAAEAASISVLDAHEEPTRPGITPENRIAAIESDDANAGRQRFEAAQLGRSGRVSTSPERARRATGDFPRDVRSPYEDASEPEAVPAAAPPARLTPSPACLPTPAPVSSAAVDESAFGAPAVALPPAAPAHGTVTLRVRTLLGVVAGTFVAGAAVSLLVSSLLGRHPAAQASAAQASAAAPVQLAAPQAPAAAAAAPPVAAEPAAAAPAPAPAPIAAPLPAAPEPEAATADSTPAARKASSRSRGSRHATAEATPKAKSQDWDDPFAK